MHRYSFTEEWRGDGMIALCSKTYFAWGDTNKVACKGMNKSLAFKECYERVTKSVLCVVFVVIGPQACMCVALRSLNSSTRQPVYRDKHVEPLKFETNLCLLEDCSLVVGSSHTAYRCYPRSPYLGPRRTVFNRR